MQKRNATFLTLAFQAVKFIPLLLYIGSISSSLFKFPFSVCGTALGLSYQKGAIIEKNINVSGGVRM